MLNDKAMNDVIVVTGGSRGIGRAISKAFADEGYNVVVGARSSSDVQDINPSKITFKSVDVCNPESHRELAAVASKVGSRLVGWINNAGLSAWRPIDLIDEEFFDQLMAVNLKAAFWGCKQAAKIMEHTGGSIINISSIAGKRGSANNSMYCATKFGMNGLTQSLAKELGPRGINVNAICPVLIKTDGLMEALETEFSPAKGNPKNFLDEFKRLNSANGALPEARDVANLALYLTRSENKAITGQCINVDCGVFPQ